MNKSDCLTPEEVRILQVKIAGYEGKHKLNHIQFAERVGVSLSIIYGIQGYACTHCDADIIEKFLESNL